MAEIPQDELDVLAAHLNATTATRSDARVTDVRFEGWLRQLTDGGGGDLLLVAGEPPVIVVQGKMTRLQGPLLDGDDVVTTVLSALPSYAQQEFRSRKIADGGVRIPSLGRFRVNLHHE